MNAERPFLRSYWALPGQLVAGFYPGHFDPAERDQKLAGLVAAGVTLSINLMEADEKDHRGASFADYSARLLEMAREAGRVARMERFEIRDRSVPAPELMVEILAAIHAGIAAGGVVYVHCWGGKGRTATVVGCYLRQYHGENAEAVLEKIRGFTSHAREAFWPTPQTAEQCQFIRDWNHANA